jgi:hypothetical protein
MKRKTILVFAAALLPLLVVGVAFGANLIFDENSNSSINGTFQAGFSSNDHGPGGLNGVQTYNLPFPGMVGDVLLQDPLEGNLILDVIRFSGNGRLLFYSDNVGGVDSLADTETKPGSFYGIQTTLQEVGMEGGLQGATYTPTFGMPGFDVSNPSYAFISDTPEPATLSLLATGAVAIGLFGWSRRRRRSAP